MTVKELNYLLDEQDYRAIRLAIKRREAMGIMPDYDGCHDGSVLAEICRGWLERVEKEVCPNG